MADAWFDYLTTMYRARIDGRYDEVEPWAWNRLVEELAVLETVPGEPVTV